MQSSTGHQDITFTFCLLPFAFYLLPFAFCLLPFTFYLLPFASPAGGRHDPATAGARGIMDQEIIYAANAGINYWAFVTYPDGLGMSNGLHLYLSCRHSGLECRDRQGQHAEHRR